MTPKEKSAVAAAQALYTALDTCIGVCDTTSLEECEASQLLGEFHLMVFADFPPPSAEELANQLEVFLTKHKDE